MQPTVAGERHRVGQKTKVKVHLSNDRFQQVIFSAEGHLLGPGAGAGPQSIAGEAEAKMAFLTGKFIKWDRLLMEMKKSPALVWARGEDRAGDRL